MTSRFVAVSCAISKTREVGPHLRDKDALEIDECHGLADEAMGLVCAPNISVDIRKPLHLPALHSQSRPGAWAAWAKSGAPKLRCSGDVVYEHFYMAIEAAMAGQGISLVSRHMVFADLQAGRLKALSDFRPDGTYYVALSEQGLGKDQREALFIDWLGELMRAHLDLHDPAAPATPAAAASPAGRRSGSLPG